MNFSCLVQIAIIEEESSGPRFLRKNRGQQAETASVMTVLPTATRKRRQLTDEEKAERKRKVGVRLFLQLL